MTAIIVVISCGLTFGVSYRLSYNGMIRALSVRANSIYEYADGRLDVETFKRLNSRADGTSYLYQEAKKTLENVRTATGVRYLYTAKEKEDGTFIYLVDGLPVTNRDFRCIGDMIEKECIPDMKKAMAGQVVLPKDIPPEKGILLTNLITAYNGIMDTHINLGDVVVISGLHRLFSHA